MIPAIIFACIVGTGCHSQEAKVPTWACHYRTIPFETSDGRKGTAGAKCGRTRGR